MNRDASRTRETAPQATGRAADIVREYGPFAGADQIHGVTWDGQRVWAATGPRLLALDPKNGELVRTLDCSGDAGSAFDGTHLYQIAEARIDKIDPKTGAVVASIPAPGQGSDSGLAWAEGSLWVGQYRDRKILQIDPHTGAILRTIESNRFVTGVTWVDGELWHGTWEGDESDIRRIDPHSGAVLERLQMPPGTGVSGMESDGADLLYCGGGQSGKIRAVRRPKRPPHAASDSDSSVER
jgi:glutamine cyclotransferase